MCLPVVFSVSGVLSLKDAFSGLSNDTVITFAGMFVIGGALLHSGTTQKLGHMITHIAKNNSKLILAGFIILTAALSCVLSNTGTVAVLLPICVGVADSTGMSRKQLLMSLAVMAATGGMISMVGTPPNATVNLVLEQYGSGSFGFFEFGKIGIPISIAAGIFLMLPITGRLIGDHKQERRDQHNADVSEEREEKQPITRQQVLSVLILLSIVAAMATGAVPLGTAAVGGALLCIITGVISPKEAIEAIDWSTIFLFAGTLSLAVALDKTGAGKLIADVVIKRVGENCNSLLLFTVLFFLCGGLTQFMSNTASAALLAPIGLEIAKGLGASPKAVLMVVAVASSCSFMTPIGTPPNALILHPGGFHFKDYLRIGVPLFLLSYLLCILIIPVVWPLLP